MHYVVVNFLFNVSPIVCRSNVMSSNSVMKFVVVLYISFAVIFAEEKSKKTD